MNLGKPAHSSQTESTHGSFAIFIDGLIKAITQCFTDQQESASAGL